MASAVSIVNFALRRLGASPITSLSDPTTEGILANDTFEEIRDELLREHLWNFATRRVSLAASATAPDWGYDRAFPLPSDFLRLVSVSGASERAVKMENTAADGRVLLTNLEAPLSISYIFRITNYDQMDPSFRRALSLRCAMEWAQKLTGTTAIVEQLAAEYKAAEAMARSVDGQEDTPDSLKPNTWILARY